MCVAIVDPKRISQVLWQQLPLGEQFVEEIKRLPDHVTFDHVFEKQRILQPERYWFLKSVPLDLEPSEVLCEPLSLTQLLQVGFKRVPYAFLWRLVKHVKHRTRLNSSSCVAQSSVFTCCGYRTPGFLMNFALQTKRRSTFYVRLSCTISRFRGQF